MYEPKWDGFRCLIFRDEEDIFLATLGSPEKSHTGAEKPLGRGNPLLRPRSRFAMIISVTSAFVMGALSSSAPRQIAEGLLTRASVPTDRDPRHKHLHRSWSRDCQRK